MSRKPQHKVLLVDDEANILSALERQLHSHFQVHTAQNGTQGLEVLQAQGPFSVIVSDMRMPEMDGAEFLAQAQKIQPFTTRILLTGHADINAAIAAINKGQIFRYLTKPCPIEILIDTLDLAIQQNKRMLTERAMLAKNQALENANTQLEIIALEDTLLGIGNRRAMETDLEHLHQVSIRYKRCYSIIFLDIDYFKQYNDHYGHQAGDLALQAVVKCIKAKIRGADRIYRYGGEELLVTLPETGLTGAQTLAQRITEELVTLEIQHETSKYGVLTTSAGISTFAVGHDSWQNLLEQADQALYQAKADGRNRIYPA